MKKIVGIVWILCLPNMAFCETYLGIGVGNTNGSDWSGTSPEVILGHSFRSGMGLELGIYDLGSRSSYRDEEASGISMEAGYSFKFISEHNYLNVSGGIYAYSSDYRTGDAYYEDYSAAPIISISSRYYFNKSLSARLKYSKIFMDKDFGYPNRISVSVIYNF